MKLAFNLGVMTAIVFLVLPTTAGAAGLSVFVGGAAVPEPTSLLALALGLGGLLARRRRT